ncbi:hypothetical protein L596_027169 [Steinernema carpocapsae]|uniref:Uncharacterized protein n=1 Tax=Steinernema carpocapsae TaxID=34508 RepID=A0A4U5M3J4_STECR|nr:hypothetical protein L596_027169 [Steinernema carpocapsae]
MSRHRRSWLELNLTSGTVEGRSGAQQRRSETDRSFPASELEMTPLHDFQTCVRLPVWPELFLNHPE